MEEHVFPRPAVADVLAKNFVEVRLHTDTHGPELKQILALRKQYSGSVAIPTYVVVDPNTLERKSRLRGLKKEDKFLEFLNDGLGR